MKTQTGATPLTTPDVLIIGGGVAGIAAAVGASRNGASVMLVEKNNFPGGKATAANVGTICGLYFRSERSGARWVQSGFMEEFASGIADRSHSSPLSYKQGLFFLPYDYIVFRDFSKELLNATIQAVHYNTMVTEAVAADDHLIELKAVSGSHYFTVKPKAVVDTTGENVVSRLLHLEYIQSDRYQAAAHVFQLSGIMETDAAILNMALLRAVHKGVQLFQLPEFFGQVSIVPGSIKSGSLLLKLPLPMQIDEEVIQQSGLELFARSAISDLVACLKAHSEIFSTSYVSYIAPETGIRTGPRNKGKILLSARDVMECKKSNDTIARGAWPAEFWEPGKKVHMEYFAMDDFYDIPSGCLQSRDVSNLFFGGRNISADDTAIASARVIGTCLATGYAAGVLAALKAFSKPTAEAVHTIQKTMGSLVNAL
jgi:hypothetical protein